MRKRSRNLRSGRLIATQSRLIAIALAVCLVGAAAGTSTSGAERAADEPLRVAVYDVPPYGGRYHDHGRLRRCDTANAGRTIHCCAVDAGEPNSHIPASLVARMTADAVTSAPIARTSDLDGKQLAAVADSSGAGYLDEQHLHYTKYANLKDALASLARGKSDTVVNSVGTLEYAISTYQRSIECFR